MNLIIEIIDGVAYAFVETTYKNACINCALSRTEKCQNSVVCELLTHFHYRRLTAKEREEVTKAMGRGME